jgi:TonB-dependent SusC/RagA subfamily outer membrane receptor
MENHDKIFNQIKTAAENAATRDFPSMENVWSRVEGKLDKKVLKKENTLWKKIAVSASILLVVSVGYQYFTSEEKLVIPKNDIVIADTTKAITPIKNENVAVSEITNPAIKENAEQILEKQIGTPNQIVASSAISETKNGYISDSIGLKSPANSAVFNSKGVAYKDVEVMISVNKETKGHQDDAKKQAPLVVIDKSTAEQDYTKVDAEEIEAIEILPDPLYIINGVHYTEKELFGPKPTSPYAPLSKLKIETISILQDEQATAIYGEKGKKGVVIITTKTGKPTFK